jgi:hypothetical protein
LRGGALLAVFWASGLSAAEIGARSMEGGPRTLFGPLLLTCPRGVQTGLFFAGADR